MNTILINQNQDRNDMEDRFPSRGDNLPCYICGRPTTPNTMYFMHIIDAGFRALHPADEATYVADGGDLGFQPIGASCLKKHPELKPYAVKE